MDIRLLWGKTGEDGGFHPVICHMLDAAHVAKSLLAGALRPQATEALAFPLGLTSARLPDCMAFLCALHDIGKISPGFQKKSATLFAEIKKQGLSASVADESDHSAVTAIALGKLLTKRGLCPRLATSIARIAGAHHGFFSLPDSFGIGDSRWGDAREDTVEQIRDILGLRWAEIAKARGPLPSGWLMFLAGLTSVSDWIASNTAFFPLASRYDIDLRDYAKKSARLADAALKSIGWTALPTSRAHSAFGDLFFDVDQQGRRHPYTPTQAQTECARLARGAAEPFLLLLEAPTGTGKTEAALWAATIAGSQELSSGIYYALPTQATSNQMLGRMTNYLRALYPQDVVQLHLLHGLADLNECFQQFRKNALLSPAAEIEPSSVAQDYGEEGSIIAREWFLGRKRGLLSPFAVGTVDQALLAALNTRHMFVRLFGLAGKTVIIDEVHAYDTYMSTILERLIEWLSALGANVILLSATLPKAQRRRLLNAYSGREIAEDLGQYPRIVRVSSGHVESVSLRVGPADTRELAIAPIPRGYDQAADLLAEKLQHGGCAAWIRNTVADAQEAYLHIRRDRRFSDAELILFHARFPVEDRLRIEQDVLDKFGKHGHRPRKAALIATQVIEQSLDLDFDFMISDLAPIDLMLQRAGRLHRHAQTGRPGALKRHEMRWIEPERDDSGGLSFGPSAFVYAPYVLMKTWLLIQEKTKYTLPSEMEALIEAVYGPEQQAESLDTETAELLTGLRRALKSQLESEDYQARSVVIPSPQCPDGFLASIQPQGDDAEETAAKMTRLGRERLTLVCAHETAKGLSLYPDGREPLETEQTPSPEQMRRYLQRSVSVQHGRLCAYFKKTPTPASWSKAPRLRHCRIAAFRDGRIRLGNQVLTLDTALGLYLKEEEGEHGNEPD